jgi:hypothetical protein
MAANWFNPLMITGPLAVCLKAYIEAV